ncbi:pentatricopeptide repeat-containing protein At1g03540 [Cynara cardunculus var. scolymus]|uniref:Pentatricopeptide repeat-containing protein n=1 Tax=Cynara cardunculus var. scolymus TaxID=59895 RepID=A0A124SD53_CYNCS|nr:pentatricopeptide repeat-containing protein At1g03540 [Cynara cardunculus var. scolymus]KVH95875.1 Pentatricopeptide repeat-containing protein [Cynara cardunculus var. scolymus]
MNLLLRRHHSSIAPFNLQSTIECDIISLCKSNLLLDAIHLLNSIHSQKCFTKKPILYAILLQTCTKSNSFNHGLQLHSHVIKTGLETDRFVGNSLLALYFKLSSDFIETKRVFDGLHFKDVVSWTSMISGFIRVGKSRCSLDLFKEMLELGVEPNGFTLSSVIKACSELEDVNIGRGFHGVVFKRGFDTNHVIACSLVDMYGRNYVSCDARKLFDEMLEPDSICWTSVISAFTRNDLYQEALGFFFSMMRKYGMSADCFTFGSVLTACGNLGRLKQGKEVHSKLITSGIHDNVFVDSSLVDMYGKCGSLDESQRVFDRITKRNSVSWSALLGGYCQKGDFDTVIELFRQMEEIDLYSFGTIIRACAGLAAVRQGKEVHCQYLRKHGYRYVIIESALIDLYAKCGCIDFASRLFQQMQIRNLITWNSIISGFARNGRGLDAIRMFNDMIKEGMKPNSISFIGVLFACSHAGLVNEGRGYFTLMNRKYGIEAEIAHYSCMVDLLGRAGVTEEAERLIAESRFKDDKSLWATLLGACTTSTDLTVAERVAKKMMDLDPNYHLSYVLLANIYRGIGRWNESVEIIRVMKERGIQKTLGKSWIDIDVGINAPQV